MSSIQNISTGNLASTLPVRPAATGQSGSFKNLLLDSIQQVNAMQQQADQAVETLMTGGDADPAAVLTAVQKADLAFRMMMQMRNKMMSAYQEVKDIRI
jgi:flagellar hook-basal body complex protein FliE